MSLGRKMLNASLWSALDSWASEIANLVVFLILVRMLGPEEFGLVALAAVFTAVATDLIGYSVSRVLVQRPDLSDGMCDTVFLLVLGLATTVAGIFVAFAPWVAGLFEAPALASILRWLCLSLVLHGIAAVPLALLTREMRFAAIAKRSLAMVTGGGMVGIGLAVSGYGAYALVGQTITQAAISALILYHASGWRPGRRASVRDLGAVWRYAASVVGNRIVGLFDERAPQFVIGLVLGPAAVGLYSVAMRLVEILLRLFVVPVNQVALPGIAAVQEDPARVRGILETGIAASSLISCPAFLGTIVIAPLFLPIALGPTWTPAVPVLQLLALRGLVWPVLLYGVSLLYGTGRPGRMLKLNLIDLAVNAVVLLSITWFGLAAVAAASSVRIIVLRWPLVGQEIAQAAGVSLARQVALMAPALVAGGLMWGLCTLCLRQLEGSLDTAHLLAVLITVGAASYPIFALIIRPGLLREVGHVIGGLRRPALDG